MALLWIEGFEGFGTTTGGAPLPVGSLGRKYPTVGVEFQMHIEDGRISGYCLEMDHGSAYFITPVLTTDAVMIGGVAFRSNGAEDYTIMAFYDGVQQGMNVRLVQATGEVAIYRDNTLIDTTVGLGLLANTWYYLELKVTCNNSTGAYEVIVKGSSQLSDTGLDTQAGGNAYHDRVLFDGATSNPLVDDIYVCDGTGSDNNDFLGDCKVVGLFPDGDDTANWTTTTPSANHYENVDENEADDDTSYVEANTANLTDLYTYDDLGAGVDDIYGLQINTECRETDANTFDIKLPVDSNGTQSDGAGLTIGTTSWVTQSRIVETDPDTGNLWTLTAINAAKFGIKVG